MDTDSLHSHAIGLAGASVDGHQQTGGSVGDKCFEMKSLTVFEVGGFIETWGFVSTRLYAIEGIHHGAMNQESVIELASIDKSTPDAHGKKCPLFVPLEMIESGIEAGIFTYTKVE